MNKKTVAPTISTAPPAPRGRRGGLVQEVVQHMASQIQAGRLKPGDQLPMCMAPSISTKDGKPGLLRLPDDWNNLGIKPKGPAA